MKVRAGLSIEDVTKSIMMDRWATVGFNYIIQRLTIMYSRTVHQIDELPLPGTTHPITIEKDRKTTDVCCCFLGIALALGMLIAALVSLNIRTRFGYARELAG